MYTLPDSFTFKFSNGTTVAVKTQVITKMHLNNITDGETLHDSIEAPDASITTADSSQTASVVPSSATSEPTVEGYPYPVVKNSAGNIAGYFLNNTGYQDTAVLVVTAFISDVSGDDGSSIEEFKKVAVDFIQKSRSLNKTKLIIDVQGNGGGAIYSGYDLFYQLFPNTSSTIVQRDRLTSYLLWMTRYGTNQTITSNLDPKGQRFPDNNAYLGPQTIAGDNYTNAYIANFSDPQVALLWTGPVQPRPSEPPFLPDNIIILTDGQCASTCATFTGLATRRAGVKTIAFGGRPLHLPMQAIGGTKGPIRISGKDIQAQVVATLDRTGGSIPDQYKDDIPSIGEPPLGPPLGDDNPVINPHNEYLNDSSGVPGVIETQFIYEAANCKLFYTKTTLFNITAQWQAVYDVAWRGARCVPGSTVNSDGTISGQTPPFTQAVVANNSALAGPGTNTIPGAANGTTSVRS